MRSTGRGVSPLWWLLPVGLLIVLVVILGMGDFLGARLIKKGSPRLTVHQGDVVTLELANSPRTRKLEICVEQRNALLGYSDFSDCRALNYFVGASVTTAEVAIPATFPVGRAVVITRLRDKAGMLVPAAPTDEKIALWVAARRAVQPVTDTGGGGGGGSGGGGGGSSTTPREDSALGDDSVSTPVRDDSGTDISNVSAEQLRVLTSVVDVIRKYLFTSREAPSNGKRTYDEHLDLNDDGTINILDLVEVRFLPETKSATVVDNILLAVRDRLFTRPGDAGYEEEFDMDGDDYITVSDAVVFRQVLNTLIGRE